MLVLTRKPREEIYIGDDICITVLAVKGRIVRLGVLAPSGVPIVRKELNNPHSPATGKPEDGPDM
jgi:carbon storage regulator